MPCGHKQFHCFLYLRIKILLSYTYNCQPNIKSKLHFYDIQNFRIVLPYLSPSPLAYRMQSVVSYCKCAS